MKRKPRRIPEIPPRPLGAVSRPMLDRMAPGHCPDCGGDRFHIVSATIVIENIPCRYKGPDEFEYDDTHADTKSQGWDRDQDAELTCDKCKARLVIGDEDVLTHQFVKEN